MKKNKLDIYFDYAAATPTHPDVKSVMDPYWSDDFANAQSVHSYGKTAETAVSKVRSTVATTLSVQPSEIVFTSGATESNSLALLGSIRAARNSTENPNIIISEVAHASVRNIGESHGREVEVIRAPVDGDGRLQPDEIHKLITDDTVLVSCEHANSEIGTIQPVSQIAEVVAAYREKGDGTYPLLHVDASQTTVYQSVKPESMNADLLTLNGQKMYGPKGVGVLWVRSGAPMSSLLISPTNRVVGDYQKIRPGTPPTPLVVGFAQALTWAQDNYQKRSGEVTALRDQLIAMLEEEFPDIQINGSREYRIANNVSVTFSNVDHDYLATKLDARGIAVATTSACQSGKQSGSAVLEHIQQDEAIRISLGISTTKDELEGFMEVLVGIM